jgi:hypothetical protein
MDEPKSRSSADRHYARMLWRWGYNYEGCPVCGLLYVPELEPGDIIARGITRSYKLTNRSR